MTAGPSASTAASGQLVTGFWRLPDKQKDELTVFKARTRASSTAFSIAVYVRKESVSPVLQSSTWQKVLMNP
jgi:hypothetical protein